MADIIPFDRNRKKKVTVEVKMMFTPDGFGIVAEKLTSIQVSPDGIMYFLFKGMGPVCALDLGTYEEARNSALELQKELYNTYNIKIVVS